jgi:hypothetical protein
MHAMLVSCTVMYMQSCILWRCTQSKHSSIFRCVSVTAKLTKLNMCLVAICDKDDQVLFSFQANIKSSNRSEKPI